MRTDPLFRLDPLTCLTNHLVELVPEVPRSAVRTESATGEVSGDEDWEIILHDTSSVTSPTRHLKSSGRDGSGSWHDALANDIGVWAITTEPSNGAIPVTNTVDYANVSNHSETSGPTEGPDTPLRATSPPRLPLIRPLQVNFRTGTVGNLARGYVAFSTSAPTIVAKHAVNTTKGNSWKLLSACMGDVAEISRSLLVSNRTWREAASAPNVFTLMIQTIAGSATPVKPGIKGSPKELQHLPTRQLEGLTSKSRSAVEKESLCMIWRRRTDYCPSQLVRAHSDTYRFRNTSRP